MSDSYGGNDSYVCSHLSLLVHTKLILPPGLQPSRQRQLRMLSYMILTTNTSNNYPRALRTAVTTTTTASYVLPSSTFENTITNKNIRAPAVVMTTTHLAHLAETTTSPLTDPVTPDSVEVTAM